VSRSVLGDGNYLEVSSKRHSGNRLEKRTVKNKKMIRVELDASVIRALEALPHPKAAAADSRLYFSSENASLRSLVKGAQRTMAAVFKLSKVKGAHCHRFRHSLASELLGKGVGIEEIARILGDTDATVRRHYAKWTPELQSRQDAAIRKIHVTDLTQAQEQAHKC